MKASIELGELSRKTLMRIAMETSDPEVLDLIVKTTKSTLVLAAVAGNEWTHRATVIALSQSKDTGVRNAALKNLA